jgi:hypothetical protein
MKMLVAAVAATLAALSTPASAQGTSVVCVVADPTGTPLNIRMQPNGAIVDSVGNGQRVLVFLSDAVTDNQGRVWHNIAKRTSAAPDGYVIARFLRCP